MAQISTATVKIVPDMSAVHAALTHLEPVADRASAFAILIEAGVSSDVAAREAGFDLSPVKDA